MKSTQGPIDVFLCPEESSAVCSPTKSPLKEGVEEASPEPLAVAAAPVLLHPSQEMNLPLLSGDQGMWTETRQQPLPRSTFATEPSQGCIEHQWYFITIVMCPLPAMASEKLHLETENLNMTDATSVVLPQLQRK